MKNKVKRAFGIEKKPAFQENNEKNKMDNEMKEPYDNHSDYLTYKHNR